MLVEVRLPQQSMGMSDAEIVEWYVEAGDHVEAGGDLVEVEAEKARFVIPSPSPGFIHSLKVEEGDVVEVRAVLCLIETTT
jgi:pyruvate/2-oxoglutarate dehydrogenase complex dihydrolipoamide acyltransferase (E2) component